MVITAKEKEYGNAQSSWREVCIKDVCESIIDCVNKTAPTVDYQTPYKMIRTSNVRDGQIDLSDVKYVTKEIFEIWTRRMAPKKGDIILTREAPLGEVGMIRTDDHIFLGQRLMQYRANPCYLDNRFLLYAFQEHAFQEQIKLLGSGATVEHMRVPDAEKLVLRLPSLPEQQAIATALSDVDALITSLDKLIAKKRDIKQATMQQLLTGKTRLPGFSGEWGLKKLGEVSEIGRGRVISHREISASLSPIYPVYSSQTSNNGIMGYIDTYDFEGEYVTWTTDGVNAGTVFYRNGRFNCTNVCGTIKLQKDNPVFVAKILDILAKRYVSKNLANPKLMNDVVKQILVPLPSTLEEQAAIATILSDMDAEIAALEQKRDKTRALKQGMMQELLTGKTRLL